MSLKTISVIAFNRLVWRWHCTNHSAAKTKNSNCNCYGANLNLNHTADDKNQET